MPIDRVEVRITDYNQRLQRTTMHGAYDTGPSGQLLGKPVLLRIFADGVIGYGHVRPTTPGHSMPDTYGSVVCAVKDIIGPMLIGRDIFDIESIFHEFDMLLPGNTNVRALVDYALHDAQGKALGVPVYKLLGGLSQKKLPLEWSISMAKNPQKIVDDAMRAKHEFGMNVMCIKAGGPQGWQFDIDNLRRVRDAVGEGCKLGLDPNTGWTVHDSIQALNAAKDGPRLDYLEQPIERRDFKGMAHIRRQAGGVPVMADEALMSIQDADMLARMEACDVMCFKLYRFGGLSVAKKIAAIAEGANILVNIGGLAVLSQLEAAAAAHFYASLPAHRCMPAGEFIFGLGVIGDDPLVGESDFKIVDGHVEPPDGPGFGVKIDENRLEKFTLLQETVT
ncbi:MAG: enolase C-terminal domain-like protein [Rhodospirillaceae bacterium]|jgi:L-alanine-DL-glutamate epimerase-like enolase superfamily enzyme